MTGEELLFFDAAPASLALYEMLKERLLALYPQTRIKVSKTQISFSDKYIYACVSLPRRKQDAGGLVFSLGLPCETTNAALMAVSQPYPGRYTHHFLLKNANDFSSSLQQYTALAHSFCLSK